jgi:hypothetical protein
MLVLLVLGGVGLTGDLLGDDRTPLTPREKRIIRDLLHERSETLSGRERQLLMDLRKHDAADQVERKDFERIKRREWGVEERGDD